METKNSLANMASVFDWSSNLCSLADVKNSPSGKQPADETTVAEKQHESSIIAAHAFGKRIMELE